MRLIQRFLKDVSTGKQVVEQSVNNVAMLLKMFAIIIYVGGAILEFVLGRSVNYITGEAGFSIASALIYWIAFFVAGTMMYGFAEIVRLLQVIADNGISEKQIKKSSGAEANNE